MDTSVPVVQTRAFLNRLGDLYGKPEASLQAKRYAALADKAREAFGGEPRFFSAPGRTELGGNHTDHNRGRVLCAAVTLDAVAAALPSGDSSVEVWSEGWDRPFCVNLSSLAPVESERGTTEALIRGVAEGLSVAGFQIGGFRAVVDSRVFPGSGLSSSAAIENLFGIILSGLYNEGKVPPVELAKIGQSAENRYFGKPCGLMDQMASAVGSVLAIDFQDPKAPLIQRMEVDFEKDGLALAVVATGATHEDLTEEYAAIPREMREVASVFGKENLRGLKKDLFIRKLPEVRAAAGDRAALRALHFLEENDRVAAMAKALADGRIKRYLKLVKRSGFSSWRYLQNVTVPGNSRHQDMALALALTESFLGKRGACRVHGGGFAGTLQAYVPLDAFKAYKEYMERLLGAGCVTRLRIRNEGACEVKAGDR
jgi:galactokinase